MLDRLTIERMEVASGARPVVVALSGGGDSVALLHLLHDALGASRLRAVVVDHALRPGSEADAARACSFAAALGVDAKSVRLNWPEASTPMQADFRSARYQALCAAARDVGGCVIAAGHTRDDQAETVLMRATRGSGLRGLAGMRALAPAPLWPEGRGLWLARPLLQQQRADLRALLRARGADWIEDPSNANTGFARVRARTALARMARQGFAPMRLAALAERLAPFADALDVAAFALAREAAQFEDDAIILDPQAWRGDESVRRHALSALLVAAGGGARAPGAEQLETFTRALAAPDFTAATLAGAELRAQRGRWRLSRDAGALLGRADGVAGVEPLPLREGVPTIWDNRVELTAPSPGWSVVATRAGVQLQRGEERLLLAAASPNWLLKERFQHVLGRQD